MIQCTIIFHVLQFPVLSVIVYSCVFLEKLDLCSENVLNVNHTSNNNFFG